MNLIEEKLEKYLNRFVKMKEERHSNFSFALYSTITCLFGIFIGQKISGIYLFYLAFILITAVPIIFRDEILGKPPDCPWRPGRSLVNSIFYIHLFRQGETA